MLRILLLLLWFPMAGFAQTYPAPLSDTVNDYAGLLPPEAEARITAALQAAREETGVHIVLATIESQADYGGKARFADFATSWFNFWGIGDPVRNDGVLILVGRADREMRIVLGDAYDVIWDGRAQRVIDQAMLPDFKNGNYAKGLEDGALMAIEQLARPFAAKEAVTESSGFPEPPLWVGLLGIAATLSPVLLFFGFVFRQRLGDFILRWRRCPKCGKRSLQMIRKISVQPGETTEGESIAERRCASCGDSRATFTTLPSLTEQRRTRAKSRSRSSGFGGGRSGGGGASGKW